MKFNDFGLRFNYKLCRFETISNVKWNHVYKSIDRVIISKLGHKKNQIPIFYDGHLLNILKSCLNFNWPLWFFICLGIIGIDNYNLIPMICQNVFSKELINHTSLSKIMVLKIPYNLTISSWQSINLTRNIHF